jgi:hypothetical protein
VAYGDGMIRFKMQNDSWIIGDQAGQLRSNAFRLAHKYAGKIVWDNFRKQNIDRRFKGIMNRELNWSDRATKYEKRKAKMHKQGWHHNYKGVTRLMAQRNTENVVKYSRRNNEYVMGVRINGLGKQYAINYKGRNQKYFLNDELTRLSQKEMDEIAMIYQYHYADFLDNNQGIRRKQNKRISK